MFSIALLWPLILFTRDKDLILIESVLGCAGMVMKWKDVGGTACSGVWRRWFGCWRIRIDRCLSRFCSS